VSSPVIPAASFRYESDLVDVVRDGLVAAVFNRAVRDEVETFVEVPAAFGVPDVSAVRFDWDVVQRRVAAGVLPLISEPAVRAVFALRRRALLPKVLAEAIGLSRDHARRTVIPLLVDRGWVTYDGDVVQLKPAARPAEIRVVTVEAKLRDWHGALGQARRQLYSADSAYIALDVRAAGRLQEDLPSISRQGIGVIAVDPSTSTMRVMSRPSVRPDARRTTLGRTLIAERGLELLSRGEHAGAVHPVFGWTLPRS
jgi:hypothetical protein